MDALRAMIRESLCARAKRGDNGRVSELSESGVWCFRCGCSCVGCFPISIDFFRSAPSPRPKVFFIMLFKCARCTREDASRACVDVCSGAHLVLIPPVTHERIYIYIR